MQLHGKQSSSFFSRQWPISAELGKKKKKINGILAVWSLTQIWPFIRQED